MSNQFDPMSEIKDGRRFSEEEALDVAIDMLRSTPAVWGQWLEQETNEARGSVCWISAARAMREGSRDLTIPELLAVIACGNDRDLSQARYQLAERFDAAHYHVAAEDARDIMIAQEREDMMRQEACEYDQLDAF